MHKSKILLGFVVLAALLALQVGAVYAAPLSATVPDGTVVSVTQTTDASNNVVFDVVVTDSSNVQQTVRLTPAEAVAAGLVTDNGGGTYTVNNVVGATVTGGVVTGGTAVDPCKVADGTNPVAMALTDFFCKGTVLGSDTVSKLHDEGYGYGLIAQACFMAEQLNTTCGDLLMDKTNKNFTDLGAQGVTNWGQLRKFVGQHMIQNLGSIMSGHAAPLTTTTTSPTPAAGTAPTTTHGHGNGNGNGGHGNGQGNGHGNKP